MRKMFIRRGMLLACVLAALVMIKAPVHAADGPKANLPVQYDLEGEQDPLEDPEIKSGFAVEDGKTYYYDESGEKHIGWLELEDGTRYFLEDGSMADGWQKIDGSWYYLGTPEDATLKSGWQKIDESWYYLGTDKDASMRTGWQKIDDSWYYLSNSGVMLTGWQPYDGDWYYMTSDGKMTTGWQKVDGKWYYMYNSGCMAKGWVSYAGSWFYMDSYGAMTTGWQKVDGSWYYMNSNGAMTTGWQKVNGSWYYMNSNGAMATKWLPYNGNWYYLRDSGSMVTGWVKDGSTWYYMSNSGAMVTGWVSVDGNWYYMDSNGAMKTGWVAVHGVWYYMYNSGAMAKNTIIEGYTLGADGAMIVNGTEKDMIAKAQGYTSDTSYLILVNLKACRVAVFSGKKGDWTCKYFWKCAPGKSSTPTVTGTFKVAAKGYYFDADGGARCYYYTQFYGNYLFHSVLYYKNGKLMDGRVGMPLSHGCVRLEINNAKWIYDNIPRNTKVVIY